MPTNSSSVRQNAVLWIVIAFLAGAAVMILLFTLRGKSLRSSAYSIYQGDLGYTDNSGGYQNCFDASLNGPQVMACLGIPGHSGGNGSGQYRVSPQLYQAD